ncbi:hypothetical protein LCGC14_2609620 [marine sediment metagenome]|uniref:Uncharacterized protein n=1 Tax=marine sediment metagenome TaxID=412755 RepID=A0A0F9CYZ1_9ZZZZ
MKMEKLKKDFISEEDLEKKELREFKDNFEDNLKICIKREEATKKSFTNKLDRLKKKYLKLQIKIKEQDKYWRSVCNRYEEKLKSK